MAVDNVIMPEKVSVGFKGGPVFSTEKVIAVNQQERRFQNISVARHSYTWNLTNADALDANSIIQSLRAFFYDRRGDFKAFLMKDWTDFQLSAEPIGLGNGSATAFQITKTYSAGLNPYVRAIQYIKAGTLTVYVDGVAQTVSGDYSVGSTGLITFSSPPSIGAEITVDAEFYVPVRFDGDSFAASLPEQTLFIMNVDLKAIEVIP